MACLARPPASALLPVSPPAPPASSGFLPAFDSFMSSQYDLSVPVCKNDRAAQGGDCLREIEETAHGLELIVEAGILPANRLASLRQEPDELTAIFVTIIKRSRQAVS